MTAATLTWCGPCRTWHIPLGTRCPPAWACPDCLAPAGYPCHPQCPRYVEIPGGAGHGI